MLFSRPIPAFVFLAVTVAISAPLPAEDGGLSRTEAPGRAKIHGSTGVRGQAPEVEQAGHAAEAPIFIEDIHELSACDSHACPVPAGRISQSGWARFWSDLGHKKQTCYQKLYFKFHKHHKGHTLYPICPPFAAPTWGYYETCWRRMPAPMPCPPPFSAHPLPPFGPVEQAPFPGVPEFTVPPQPGIEPPDREIPPDAVPPAAPDAPDRTVRQSSDSPFRALHGLTSSERP
jgi:hypothetical protein